MRRRVKISLLPGGDVSGREIHVGSGAAVCEDTASLKSEIGFLWRYERVWAYFRVSVPGLSAMSMTLISASCSGVICV
jgi:hypothetical protein